MKFTIDRSHEMSARELSNVLYAVGHASKRQSVLADYAPLFNHCQVVVALHLRDNSALTEKDCVGLMVGYSRSETMNDDMKRIFQQAVLDRSYSPATVVNLLHCFQLDKMKSHRLFDRCLQLLDSHPHKFSASDLIRLASMAMRFMEDRLDDVDGTVASAKDFLSTIDRCLQRVSLNHTNINLLDIVDLYEVAAHHAVQSDQSFAIVFKYYRLYLANMTIEQIDVIMSGMVKVVSIDTEESRQFVADVKYRLKVLLRAHRPQAKLESMRSHAQKIGDEKIRSMFARILK